LGTLPIRKVQFQEIIGRFSPFICTHGLGLYMMQEPLGLEYLKETVYQSENPMSHSNKTPSLCTPLTSSFLQTQAQKLTKQEPTPTQSPSTQQATLLHKRPTTPTKPSTFCCLTHSPLKKRKKGSLVPVSTIEFVGDGTESIASATVQNKPIQLRLEQETVALQLKNKTLIPMLTVPLIKPVPTQTELLSLSSVSSNWDPWNNKHYVMKGDNIGGFIELEKYLGGGTFGRVFKAQLLSVKRYIDILDPVDLPTTSVSSTPRGSATIATPHYTSGLSPIKINSKFISERLSKTDDLSNNHIITFPIAAKFFKRTSILCNDKDENYSRRAFRKEVEIMASVNSYFTLKLRAPCPIVSLMGSVAYLNVEKDTNTPMCNPLLLMEFMDLGSITNLLKRARGLRKSELFLLTLIVSFATGVCQLIDELHTAKYYHQDIKTANFLCKYVDPNDPSVVGKKECYCDIVRDTNQALPDISYCLKVADMGFSCSMSDPLVSAKCRPTGTILYIAPELHRLKAAGVKIISNEKLLRSSETYSVVCTIKDMFWKCRETFGINVEDKSSTLSKHERLDKKNAGHSHPTQVTFNPSPKSMRYSFIHNTTTCLPLVTQKHLKERLRCQLVDVCVMSETVKKERESLLNRIIDRFNEFDICVHQILLNDWSVRPNLQTLRTKSIEFKQSLLDYTNLILIVHN